MDSQTAGVRSQEVQFPGGSRACLLSAEVGADAQDLLRALNIDPPRAVILLLGGPGRPAEAALPRLTRLVNRGVMRAAARSGAAILSCGLRSGVPGLLGKPLPGRQGMRVTRLGIVPEKAPDIAPKSAQGGTPEELALATGDPDHTHYIILNDSTWEEQAGMMAELAEALSRGGWQKELGGSSPEAPPAAPVERFTIRRLWQAPEPEPEPSRPAYLPVVAILTEVDDEAARWQALECARRGWPVILLLSTGGLSNTLAGLIDNPPAINSEPELAEIAGQGDLRVFPAGAPASALEQFILRQLSENETLKHAWEIFSHYDLNALRHQKEADHLQKWILRLGVLTTALVLLQTTLRRPDLAVGLGLLGLPQPLIGALTTSQLAGMDAALRLVIIALPIVTSILLASASRFNAASKHVLLRGSAEAIKGEIFRYRTQRRNYDRLPATSEANGSQPQAGAVSQVEMPGSPEARLARRVEAISRELMQTQVNTSALIPYRGLIPPFMEGAAGIDDGLSFLTPERYISIRIGDQIRYYQNKTARLEQQLKRLQWGILIAGGVGAFLAAVGLELWVALTTSLAAAIGAYLVYQQLENRLVRYNQTAIDLANVRAWWAALSPGEQGDQRNIDLLVRYTEEFLATENKGWMQQMQDALDKLRQEQAEKDKK